MIEVVAPEEPGGRVAGENDARPHRPDRTNDLRADLHRVSELAVVHRHDPHACQAEHLPRRLRLDQPHCGQLGSILGRILRAPIAVREDQQVNLPALGAPALPGYKLSHLPPGWTTPNRDAAARIHDERHSCVTF